MSCEEYRKALIAAAAGGERELPRKVRAHLESCRGCSAALRTEQDLFAAINSGVQRVANAEVPPSLLPRVRERICHEASLRRSFIPYMVFAVAAASAVLVLVAVREWRQNHSAPQLISATDRPTLPKAPPESVIAHSVKPDRPFTRRPANTAYVTAKETHGPQFAVLIPAGQKEAVDKFLSALQSGAVKPGEAIFQNAEASSTNFPVSSLAIAPIEVKPLAIIAEESESGNEATNP